MAAQLQKQTPEMVEYNQKMKELQGLYLSRQKLISQKNENEMVKKELSLVEDDDVVYKLNEGNLEEEDPLEAEMCVDQRLDYLNSELKKCDTKEVELKAQVDDLKKKLATQRPSN
ncbi:prefoldin subunit, putative [Entamoeba invadens IP1]|uniref:prefoldin subunit, putative n=1 Tax=Entamoeba invadens IP1 TaxID=370355 RepID=UPI0002C3D5A7|nr:prefoldin subunit, putative [Entamoeba invadens IP1]ELP85282.1 prefoldin subunit, putative [Entamoeba invadens IP1]|eukprot:XP_004184628.1 prefoldin subunit, putative [Entamoeba invadens IP1]